MTIIPLSLYGSNVAASVSTDSKAAPVSGGAGSTNTILIGTSTGWGEVWSQGNVGAWAGAGSIGTPTDHGWFLDTNLLDGQRLLGGIWNTGLKFNVSVGSINVDFHLRVFDRSTGPVFTQIGSDIVNTNVTITTSAVVHSPSPAMPYHDFPTGNRCYFDLWMIINSNSTASGTATLVNFIGTSGTQGNGNHMEIDTAGYSLTPTSTLKTVGNHRSIGRVR